MALDNQDKAPGKGVWKSGKGKGRHHTKGRQLQDAAWDEVRTLLGSEHARVSALHEQSIRDLGDGLVVSAREENGVRHGSE